MKPPKKTTHFGYETVEKSEKVGRVREVFSSVAEHYDIMNDLMSLGVHRLWKRAAVEMSAVRPGQQVLDLACGSGDLAVKFAPLVGDKGLVMMSDINADMLTRGRERLLNEGFAEGVCYAQADAEQLPFADNSFDCVTMAFGLRNVTEQSNALAAILRVLKPGGRVIVLEFSKPVLKGLKPLYDAYSFTVLPFLGKLIAKDEDSYRYLAESIRKHPDQATLQGMMEQVGFERCDYSNLSGGIVAIHRGYKI